MTEEAIKEYLDRAMAIGKGNTSDMASHILEKIDQKIGEGIEKYVNGKIRKLTDEVREHNMIVQEHYRKDKEWKDSAEAVLELGRNMQGTSKVILWVTGFIIAIGGAYEVARGVFDK